MPGRVCGVELQVAIFESAAHAGCVMMTCSLFNPLSVAEMGFSESVHSHCCGLFPLVLTWKALFFFLFFSARSGAPEDTAQRE